ncbi:MAG: hypothetical protein GX594_05840 [Pirellulaceae bacterium]|nr:hypothetical protein [Pirellulaceae bacterium]
MKNMIHPSTLAALLAARPTIAALCLLLLAGCGNGDPFAYVRVSGKVTYEDGTLIPVPGIVLKFYPQSGELDAKTHPRPGMTKIDAKTGEFSDITSHHLNDGLVRGKHKVVLLAGDYQPLPPNLVPPEYSDPFKTPLEVDTADLSFHIRVRKP